MKSRAKPLMELSFHHFSFIKKLTNATIIQIEIKKKRKTGCVKQLRVNGETVWLGAVSVAVFVGCSNDIVNINQLLTILIVNC